MSRTLTIAEIKTQLSGEIDAIAHANRWTVNELSRRLGCSPSTGWHVIKRPHKIRSETLEQYLLLLTEPKE